VPREHTCTQTGIAPKCQKEKHKAWVCTYQGLDAQMTLLPNAIDNVADAHAKVPAFNLPQQPEGIVKIYTQ
jgi:hypothetical protein